MVVIGDVSGKGLKAAMTGAFAIGALDALAAEIPDPPKLLSRLNHEILRGHDRGFITCLCLKLSPDGQMIVSNAGHLSPYRNGEELICEGGPPLGLFPNIVYMESRFEIDDGDILTLLSDGVVEATGPKDEEFGAERTQAIIGHSAQHIAAAAQQFGQTDDITVVKLKHTPVHPLSNLHRPLVTFEQAIAK
jgi:serine phosphatase RsbU (regulator of sigma subunit)